VSLVDLGRGRRGADARQAGPSEAEAGRWRRPAAPLAVPP